MMGLPWVIRLKTSRLAVAKNGPWDGGRLGRLFAILRRGPRARERRMSRMYAPIRGPIRMGEYSARLCEWKRRRCEHVPSGPDNRDDGGGSSLGALDVAPPTIACRRTEYSAGLRQGQASWVFGVVQHDPDCRNTPMCRRLVAEARDGIGEPKSTQRRAGVRQKGKQAIQ